MATAKNRNLSSTMQICFISDFYPTVDRAGGIGVYTHTVAHALAARGHEVHVLMGKRQHGYDVQDGPVQVHIRRVRWIPFVGRWLEGLGESICLAWALFILQRKYRFDIVEFPNWEGYGFVPALLRVAPIVVRLHTSMTESVAALNRPPKLNERYMIWSEKMSARLACAIVTHSQYQWKTLGSEYGLKTATIIPHGIVVPNLSPITNPDLSVLSVGSLNPRKGADTLLAAIPQILKEVPDVEFWIVGSDGENKYETEFRRAHPEIPTTKARFLGVIGDNEIRSYYKRCSVYASASIHESFGITFIEAMAHEKPVVACAATAMLETIVHEKTGILVPPRSPSAFANAIIRLLQDHTLCETLGRNGRERVLKYYTADRMAQQIEKLFQSLSSSTTAERTSIKAV